jgi:hypothetical protein
VGVFTEFKEDWLSDGFIQLLCFLVFLAAIGDVALYNNLFLLKDAPTYSYSKQGHDSRTSFFKLCKTKMKICVHRTRMPPLTVTVNRGMIIVQLTGVFL